MPSQPTGSPGSSDGVTRFLRDYGPRLAVFALLVGVGAALVALRFHLKTQENEEVSQRLDAVLAMPETEHDARINALRALLQTNRGCEAEPWVLLCLGNQLYKKAYSLQGGDLAQSLDQEAYNTYRDLCARFPGHTVAPLALFSQACCAEQMGNAVDAIRLFKDLEERYPQTYLVAGSGSGSSMEKRHTEGLTERIQKLREAFPSGKLPAPPAPPTATSDKKI